MFFFIFYSPDVNIIDSSMEKYLFSWSDFNIITSCIQPIF